MADEVKNGLSAIPDRIPSKWNRQTVADGTWLQKYTLNPLSARDVYLAEQIDKGNGDVTYVSGKVDELSGKTLVLSGELSSTSSFLSGAIDNVSAGVDFVSAGVDGVSSIFDDFHTNEYEQFVNDVTQSASDLNGKIDEVASDLDDEIVDRTNADTELQNQIDKLEAATDVICVYGTYSGYDNSFSNASGDLFKEPEHLTENDVIKVLNDNSDTGESGQTYWQATNVDWETSSCTWTRIGKLEPYYTKSEINTITGNITSDISNTYLSAKGAVHQGKNIVVTEDSTKPEITISTSADVEFTNVSSTNISATNVTALTANGNSAKFTNLSSTNLTSNNISSTKITATTAYITNLSGASKSDTVDNLFSSAYSGAYASAWINDNKNKIAYTADFKGTNNVVTGYGTSAFAGGISSISAKTGNSTALFTGYNVNLQAGEGVGFNYGTNLLTISADGKTYAGGNYIQISGNNNSINVTTPLVNSAGSGYSAYDWITTKSATLSAGSGINFNSAAPNTLGISVNYTTTNGYVTELNGVPLSAGSTYQQGDYIKIDENNKINLATDISADHISGSIIRLTTNQGQYGVHHLYMDGRSFNYESNSSTTWLSVQQLVSGYCPNGMSAQDGFYTEFTTPNGVTNETDVTPAQIRIVSHGTGGGNGVILNPTGVSYNSDEISWSTIITGHISGNGTITAIVSASQAGSTRGVLYFV